MFIKNLLMNKLALVLPVFLTFFLAVPAAQAVAPKYPAVKEWLGQAWVTGKNGQRTSLRQKHVLREKAVLETGADSEVKIQLDEKRTLTLLSNSELLIPVISWEGGEAPVLILKSGSLHWQQDLKEKGPYSVALRSDLFEFIVPGGDFIFSIDPKKALSQVKVMNGTLEFSALNGENSVTVKSGEQASFQGVLEGGEISYDVLLKGRKIPKGTLSSVSAIDAKELNRAAEAQKKKLKEQAQKKKAEQAAIAKSKRPGTICAGPPAKLNECVWVCLNNPKKEKKNCLVTDPSVSCVRRRCNANGDWAEETPIDAEKASTICQAQPVIAPCDY